MSAHALRLQKEASHGGVAGLDGALKPSRRRLNRLRRDAVVEIDTCGKQHVIWPQMHRADLVDGADRFVGANLAVDKTLQSALHVPRDGLADDERTDLDRHEYSDQRQQQSDRN